MSHYHDPTQLNIDPTRLRHEGVTGIFVRGQMPDGKWRSIDIASLTDESLVVFVKSRGEASAWAVGCVEQLLQRLREIAPAQG